MLVFVACDDETNNMFVPDPYDHESQIAKDQDSLWKYFDTHYYDASEDAIALIDAETPSDIIPLSEDTNLDSIVGIQANETETDYTMYFYKTSEGSDPESIGYPTTVDSVFVNYTGFLLSGYEFDSRPIYPIWFSLSSVVQGWAHGITKFKGGDRIVMADDDFYYENAGSGFIFMPSGLGYKNIAQIGIPENSPLVFHVKVNQVHLRDHDLDLVPSKYEIDFDAAGNIELYDTDGDGVYDYLDKDDDNDGTITKVEVMDEFGPELPVVFDYGADGSIIGKGTASPQSPNGSIPNYLDETKQ